MNYIYPISVLEYLSRFYRIILIKWCIFRFNKLWVYSNSPLSTFCLNSEGHKLNYTFPKGLQPALILRKSWNWDRGGSIERRWNVSKTACSGRITYLHKNTNINYIKYPSNYVKRNSMCCHYYLLTSGIVTYYVQRVIVVYTLECYAYDVPCCL